MEEHAGYIPHVLERMKAMTSSKAQSAYQFFFAYIERYRAIVVSVPDPLTIT